MKKKKYSEEEINKAADIYGKYFMAKMKRRASHESFWACKLKKEKKEIS